MKIKNIFKVLTVGGAVQDVAFHSDAGVLIDNINNDLTKQKLVGFEYGAKINVKDVAITFGGGAANSAVCLARLQAAVTALVAVGDDQTGKNIIANLKREKINTKFISTVKQVSGFSVLITYGKKRQDHVLFTYRGANEDLKVKLEQIQNLKPAWIYLAALSGENWERILYGIFAGAKKCAGRVAWNPGNLQLAAGLEKIKNYLKNTDILIVNKDEAVQLLGVNKIVNTNPRKLLMDLRNYCSGVIVLTAGELGAYALMDKDLFYQPVVSLRKKDTVGVGDAFGSTFVWAFNFFKQDVQKALLAASLNAAAVINQPGAQAGLLQREDLLALLKEY
ncbi:MAG TPA: carbohydrate kinase family protein [bacterium]|nr:carbohydrate kinase family protein [bacterium]